MSLYINTHVGLPPPEEGERASPEQPEPVPRTVAHQGNLTRLSSHFRVAPATGESGAVALSDGLKERIRNMAGADQSPPPSPSLSVREAVASLLERMRSLAATGAFEG